MDKQFVNGKCYDWSSVTIKVSGCEDIEPLEISYDDEQDAELIYGKGGNPRGYGTGAKKNSCKISLLREDLNTLINAMKKSGTKNFYSYIIPKITVSYADEGATTSTDVLNMVKLNKRSLKAAQGDKSMKADLDGFCIKGIKINGLDA